MQVNSCVRGILKHLLNQQLGDLDAVGGSALTDLVTAAPEADTVVIGEVGTNPAHEHQILVGSKLISGGGNVERKCSKKFNW